MMVFGELKMNESDNCNEMNSPCELWQALNGGKGDFASYLKARNESDIRSEILMLIKNKGGVEKLRDKFAVAAIQGLLAASEANARPAPEIVAAYAYEIADTMLKARK
jgi:hypothetical protein